MYSFATLILVCLFLPSYVADYVEDYYSQRVDHFNIQNTKMFEQRYLYNDSWWDPQQGPIFFYTGNERSIDIYWKNTGFVRDIARHFKALVIFAEHRFYGKSLPYGTASLELENVDVLCVAQAANDYAVLINALKQQFQAENNPVIAFGGSYGGILAAYMRLKFPNIIQGAIASSAPLYGAMGKVSDDAFYRVVTKDFRQVSLKCKFRIRAEFLILRLWAALGRLGRERISQTFQLCPPLKSSADVNRMLRWLRRAFSMVAVRDYPYPVNFVTPLPAFPVKVVCDRGNRIFKRAPALRAALEVYYNGTGDKACYDIDKEFLNCADTRGCTHSHDSMAWDYQICTEIDLKGGTNGIKDMFPYLPFTASMKDEYCLKRWNVKPRRTLNAMFSAISSSSNIVFSNGDLDPYHPQGVLRNISDSIVSILIEGAAHHLDLRSSNPADPPSVIKARNFEMQMIQKWIDEYSRSQN